MKFLIPFFFAFLLVSPLHGADEEINVLQELIIASQKNLTSQKELLLSVVRFKQARAAFIEEPSSGKLAAKLVHAAMSVEKKIEQEHLAHLFSSEFLTEVHFFNQLGRGQKP